MINIFKNPITSTYSQKELTLQLVKFYTEWKKLYLKTVKPINDCCLPKAYIYSYLEDHKSNNAVTCSEAMGYGMLIFSMMYKFDTCAKEYFTNLYNFIKAYPSCCNNNLMAWEQINKTYINIDEISAEDIVNSDCDSATDGDMDISYGLLIADKLWSKTDRIDYKSEAIKRIQALMDCCVDKNDYSLTTGDKSKGFTRSSDFIIYNIRAFAKVDSKNLKKWNLVIDRIEKIINNQMNQESNDNGLMPDFLEKKDDTFIPKSTPKNSETSEDIHDADYYTNSCRIPWRYSMDPILNKKIPISKQLSTLNRWIMTTTCCDPENIKSGYYLGNGTPGKAFGDSNNLAFISPFLVSSLLQKDNPNWPIDLWKYIVNVPIENSNFFGNTLKLMAMIVVTGNWISP